MITTFKNPNQCALVAREITTLNPTQLIARCSEVIAGEWLGSSDEHIGAELTLGLLIDTIYNECEHEQVVAALEALSFSYRRTIIANMLDSRVDAEILAELDMLEVTEDDIQAMFDSGQATPISDEDARKLIKDSSQ